MTSPARGASIRVAGPARRPHRHSLAAGVESHPRFDRGLAPARRSNRRDDGRDQGGRRTRRALPTPHDVSRRRTDHLERHDRGNRNRLRFRKRAGFFRVARPRSQANLNRRPHSPWPHNQAGQQLFADAVRSRRQGGIAQASDLAEARIRRMARSGIAPNASERPGHRPRRQAGSNGVEHPGKAALL